MARNRGMWDDLVERMKEGLQQLVAPPLDCEYEVQTGLPDTRRERTPERSADPLADEHRALESALLEPAGALAAAAQMLRAQRQGNGAAAGIMARRLRQQMQALEARFPGLAQLADGTRYGRMINALRTIARADSAQPGFAQLARREIDAGLAALPEKVRMDLLSIDAFSALREAPSGNAQENR